MADTARISSLYQHGTSSKTPGFTQVISGHRIPKHDPACDIHGATDALANRLAKLSQMLDQDYDGLVAEDDLYLIGFLRDNIYNVSGFCFTLGLDLSMSLGETYRSRLDERITQHQKNLDGTDFIAFSSELTILIDECRILVRQAERAYFAWLYDERIVGKRLEIFVKDPEKFLSCVDAQLSTANALNTLSTWFFWLARSVAHKEHSRIKEWNPADTSQ